MYIKNESRVHFTDEVRKLDGRKNIDDVWWVNSIGDRRREISNIDEEIAKLQDLLFKAGKRIHKINTKINKKNYDIAAIKEWLKIGSGLAGGALAISLLGAGVTEGFQIWCGLMAVPIVVGASAVKVVHDFKGEIAELEEDKIGEEIEQESFERSIESLTNKKNVLLGLNQTRKTTVSHDIVDRPLCSYYQLKPDGDDNNYSDVVFQVGGDKPYNWTAHKLIRRVSENSQENDVVVKTKTR